MTLQSRLADLVAAVGADIKDLKSKTAILAPTNVDNWHTVGAAGEPAFGVKWQAFPGYTPQFKKMPDGTVRIRGMVSPAVSGGGTFTTVFNLPPGYRPSADIIRPGMASTTAAEILIDIRIGANGDVQFGVATSSYHTIDISFPTDQPSVYPVAAASVSQEGWHLVGGAGEPVFQNSWVNHAVGSTVKFRKRPDGVVQLRGIARGGAPSTVIFTLPVGYRPDELIHVPTVADWNAAGAPYFVSVDTNGAVSLVWQGASTNVWISLADLEFDTGQTTFPASKSVIPVVSALPANPSDTDEIYFQTTAMANAGVMWHLRYRAKNADGSPNSSLYKWEVIGSPPPLYDEVTAAQASTSGTTWVDLATVGPQITVPLAGDYMFTGELDGYTADSASSPFVALKFGAAAVLSADRVFIFRGASATTKGGISGRSIKRTVIAANTVVKLQYSNATNSAATVTFENRTLQVRPIRVG